MAKYDRIYLSGTAEVRVGHDDTSGFELQLGPLIMLDEVFQTRPRAKLPDKPKPERPYWRSQERKRNPRKR